MTIEQHLPHRLLPIARQVAYTCRIPMEGAALALCSSLAGISSGREGARDCNGTPIATKFNVILAGPPGPFRSLLIDFIEEDVLAQILNGGERRHRYLHDFCCRITRCTNE